VSFVVCARLTVPVSVVVQYPFHIQQYEYSIPTLLKLKSARLSLQAVSMFDSSMRGNESVWKGTALAG
jgi:hypothetical protein